MTTIDNRVVEMSFNNQKFASGVQGTMSMLDRLKSALHLGGAAKGLQDVNAAAAAFNGAPMEQGVGRIAGSFSAMQAVAFGALANVGAMISNTAVNMAKSFTLEPLMAGFQEYELKMGSIQTIMANTSRHGTTLETVNHELEVLNEYADQTIYNFGDMTKNIGLFTNAGIKVEDATTMIKGFSNAAASSGTSAEGAAHAAYQLSQALSTGTIRAQDWMSLTNAGMGNKNMQESLVGIAEAMGTFEDTSITADDAMKDVKGTLEEGWLTADVMSNYLKIMSGDMDDASIAALGLSEAQVKMLRDQANTGFEAATKVRTFTQLMSTLRESVGSGWSESFAILFGDFNEATELFTGINNAVGGFLGRMSDSRNAMLQEFKDNGGRTALIEGLTEAFWALGTPLAVIGQAFRQVFPKTTGKQLADMVKSFRDFMVELQPGPETLDRLRRTFAGVFAILHIGWTVIKAIAGFFLKLFQGVEEGDKGILKFTATIGDFFVGLDKALSSGQGLNKFFDQVFKLVMKVINPIKDFGQVIGNVFGGIELGDAGAGFGKWISDLLTFGEAVESAGDGAEKGKSAIERFFDFFKNIASKVKDFVAPLTENISGMFEDIDYDQVMKGIQTGLLGGLVLVIKQLGGVFSNISLFSGGDDGPGFIDKIKEGMDGLTGTLSAMQANLKASMLVKIALAIGILAISVVLLAGVDTAGLIRATSALTVMFIQLGAAMYVFQKIGTVASITKLNLMGAALILISIAILILTAAVRKLSEMSWEELGKGMAGLTALMLIIIGMSKGLDKSRGAILRSAAALIIMGGALHILIFAVQRLANMNMTEMAKGIGGVAAILAAVALYTRLAKSGPGALTQAASILLLSSALVVLAEVVKKFAALSWHDLAKGFAGISAGLIAMGIALKFMPSGPKLLLTAFSLGKISASFGLLAKAFAAFGPIAWNTIAKGVVAIIGSLGVVALAMKLMPDISIKQIASLLAVSWAIRQVVDSLTILGDMNAGALGKSMAVFSGVLAVIVLALNKMEGSAEGAASIAVVAGSFQLLETVLTTWGKMDLVSLAKGMGALIGVLAIMTIALNQLDTEAAGAAALALVAGALSLLVPVLVTLGAMPLIAIGAALVALAGMFAILVLGLKLLQPVIPVLMAFSIAIGLLGAAMALAGAGVFLFSLGLTALATAGAAGTAAIVGIVSALIGLIPLVMEQIGLGLVAFAGVIATAGPAITMAIVSVLVALMDAIIIAIPKLLQTLEVLLTSLIGFLTRNIPRLVQLGFDMLMGLLNGISRNIGRIVDKATDIIVNFVNGLIRNLPRLIQAGIDLVIAFIRGIGDGIRKNGPAIADAAWDMVTGLVDGIVNGILSLGGKLLDALWDMVSAAWDGVLDFFGINSPSTEGIWLGRMIDQGIANGLTKYSKVAENAAVDMGDNVLTSMSKTISGLGDMIAGDVDMNPVISPVLDLSEVRKSAAGIATLLEATPLDVGASYFGAANASAEYRSNQAVAEADAAAQEAENIMFVQNNYSPKAISPAETFRNTRSQLSLAKEALKTNAD